MSRHNATREEIEALHKHRREHGWPQKFDGDRCPPQGGMSLEEIAESLKRLGEPSDYRIPDALKPKPRI